MSLEPFTKCRDVAESLVFYTEVLDFEAVVSPDPDPNAFMSKYGMVSREGCRLHLSAHAGDGAFGGLLYIRVKNLDELYQKFLARGLNSHIGSIPGVCMQLTEQTWGMKEFLVRDPDNNKLTFGEPLV